MSHPSIPAGSHSVPPNFAVEDISAAIALYEKAVGAVEKRHIAAQLAETPATPC